jgi:hypothetical protein
MPITVIGAYLPRLDQEGIAQFIERDVASFKNTMLDLIKRRISNSTEEDIEERALELPEELDADLQRCALFEVEITDFIGELDPTDFCNPDTGCVGYEPAFLSLDGMTVIADAYNTPSKLTGYRVAFYIHEWDDASRLVVPDGPLELPIFKPVPERLWELAPYSCLD